MKKLLFNFSNVTQFNEQFKLVEVIHQNGSNFEILFLVNDYSGTFNLKDLLVKITNSGCKYFLAKEIVNSKKKSLIVSLLFKIPKRIINVLSNSVAYNYPLYRSKLHESRAKLKTYKEFLEGVKPDLLIISEDGAGANIHLIQASKESGIKSMILPYEYSSQKQMIIGATKRYVYHINDTGLSKKEFEKYYFKIDNKYCGFFSKEEVKAYLKTNSLPDKIKTVHGGMADKIASESQAMNNHYLKEGLSSEKIILTGSVNDDILLALHESKELRKEKLYAEFGFNKVLPLIVFSFIPEYPDNKMFGSYSNYIISVSKALSQQNKYNVFYQFHPAVPEEQRNIARNFKLKISELPTIELISMCDLYITSYSSTIRWAIAASIPVVHLDLYDFDYEDFKSCKGIEFVSKEQEFTALINDLNSDDKKYTELKNYQIADAPKWGTMDGKSGERILNLIKSLCR